MSEHVCKKHNIEKEHTDCWKCGGEGFSHHDCGEDTCCCLEPEDNVECDICEGHGGWHVCLVCNPYALD